MQRASVTQDGKDQVSDVDGVVEIQVGKTNGVMDLPVNEENVTQLAVRLSISTSSCDNISMEPSGLICVIKKNSLWDEYRHSL